MEQELDAKTYRAIANFLEQELEYLTSYSEEVEELFVPVIGNLQYFSRPVPEINVLSQQLGLLHDQVNEAIEILNLLALTTESKDKLPVHPLLKKQLKTQVTFFIDYYDAIKNQSRKNGDSTNTADDSEEAEPKKED